MTGFRDAIRELPDAVFLDFLESDDAYRLRLDLPGVDRDALSVDVTGNRLHVDARRDKDVPDDFTYRREDRAVFLEFDVPLPPNVAAADAAASLDAGVLTVTLPKAHDVRVPVEE